MSCTVCGSTTRCNCGPTLTQDPAFCCQPTSGGCCQNVVSPTPTPFYSCAPACPESHVQKITIQSFSADVKISDSWNVPECDMSAVVNGESLHAIVVGSYLWNPTYGYFLITAFNSGTGQLTLLNPCTTGNAAPGTQIPACTEFTVTVPPCDCTNDSQVCVAIDFTAPDNGDCIDITLTNTTGILVGNVIQIGSGQYRVSALKPNDIITICNDGDGITPGTSVIAKDSSGNYQYCIQVIASNPCDADTVEEGNALVCNGSGIISPIVGTEEGQVLTLIDGTFENAAYRSPGSVIVDNQTVNYDSPHSFTAAGQSQTGVITFVLPNPSTTKSMGVLVTVHLTIGIVTGVGAVQALINIQQNGGGYTAAIQGVAAINDTGFGESVPIEVSSSVVYTIAPSTTLTLDYQGVIGCLFVGVAPGSTVDVTAQTIRGAALGVAL